MPDTGPAADTIPKAKIGGIQRSPGMPGFWRICGHKSAFMFFQRRESQVLQL